MYAPFLGLQNNPFEASDRPAVVFPESHKAELLRLVFAMQKGGAFVELVIEGVLPTLPIAKYLIESLPDNSRCVFIANPRLSTLGFLHAVCQQLEVTLPSKEVQASDLLVLIKEALADGAIAGETTVLVLNDAQKAPAPVLKQLADLSREQGAGESLLGVVLMGNTEMRQMLALAENAPLAKRINRRVALPELGVIDTANYISERMSNAGWTERIPFDAAALAEIHAVSGGTPQKIDLICDRAIQKAQAMKKHAIDLKILKKSGALNIALPPSTQTGARSASPRLAAPAKVTNPQEHVAKDNGTGKRPPNTAPSTPPKWLKAGAIALAGLGLLAGLAFLLYNKAGALPESKVETPSQGAPRKQTSLQLELTASPTMPLSPEAVVPPPPDPPLAPKASVESAAPAPETTPPPDFASLEENTDANWEALGKLWRLNLRGDVACRDALGEGHQCFRSLSLEMPGLRNFNRPALVKLYQRDTARWVQLLNINGNIFTLASGGQTWRVTEADFEKSWQGYYSTLWRLPPQTESNIYSTSTTDPAGKWLDQQLVALQKKGLLPAHLATAQDRLDAFQTQENLPGEGKALPSTFMRLNQLIGVPEPMLTR